MKNKKEIKMVRLEDWHFAVEMGFGGDAWRLYGKAYDHPNFKEGAICLPSTIVSFDKELMQIKTLSGREYQLGIFKQLTPKWGLKETLEEIQKVIDNGGYETK